KTSIATLALEERTRADHDPDYRWLVADLAALDSMRKQSSISLNLADRKAERERLDHERLARENERRTAMKLPLLKTVDEFEGETAPDAVLEQATEIMGDVVAGVPPAPPPTQTVKRADPDKPEAQDD
ncbi:MAG: carboxy terminal-processing peptidase, partial [Pseudomonadales bacterium]|nr:carboxy terminal-processing peptidase [Pseudomonadales bacterium]